MKLDKIKLSENITLHKCKLEYNRQSILDEVYFTIDKYENTIIDTPNYPGTQTDLVVKNGEWHRISEKVSKIILEEFYKDTKTVYVVNNWMFLSNIKNTRTAFHEHLKMKSLKVTGEWNYTFYVQMPDKLKGDDGHLVFKDDDNEYSILPKEGELYIFDAKYLHAPKTNTSSDKERIVLAGTYAKIDPSISRRRTIKGLL